MFISSNVFAKCRYLPNTLEDAFYNADKVMLVLVRNAYTLENNTSFEANYELLEPFKGKTSKNGKLTYESNVHSLLLTPGESYLIFLKNNNYVSICHGSKLYKWHRKNDPLVKLRGLAKKGL